MKKTHQNKQNIHIPVLLDASLKYLAPNKGDKYLDITAGYGGHAQAVLEKTLSPSRAVLVDRDAQAIAFLKSKYGTSGTKIIKNNFLDAVRQLNNEGHKFNIILADLGVSSLHLNEASRGFSIVSNGPLDMRMDQEQELVASDIANNYKEADLESIIRDYGEDPKAKTIAKLIVNNRPINGTEQLASIIKKAWHGYSKVHPATRTFQAIRIVVNDELNQIEKALPILIDLLEPGGRIVIISFHSLEDRIVKNFFSELSGNKYDSEIKLLTKHPVSADRNEIVTNPRARSAKLRAAVK